jgi:predicted aspartyl protease
MNRIFRAPIARPFKILLCLAITSLSAEGAAAKSPISLDVLQRDGYGSVKLTKGWRNNTLYVPAEINGRKIDLLLDTGWDHDGITVGMNPAELHIVSQKSIEIGISASGNRTAFARGIAQSVVMGNRHIENTEVNFGRLPEFGVLGHNFLKKCGAIIDLTNLKVCLPAPGGGRRVNLSPALTSMGLAEAPILDSLGGRAVVNVEVNGVPTQMELDTGSQLSELDIRFATEARTKGWGRRHVVEIDSAGKLTPADFAGTKTFKIEGIPIRTPTVLLKRFAGYDLTKGKIAGLLGLDVIGLNWGIIDFGQQKFYFARAN